MGMEALQLDVSTANSHVRPQINIFVSPNLGYGRQVPKEFECGGTTRGKLKVHRSVQFRQTASGVILQQKYVPKIQGWDDLLKDSRIIWVD